MHFLMWLTIGFFSLIVFFFFTSFEKYKNVSGFSTQQHLQHRHHRLFQDPKDIPISVLAQLDAVLILGGGVPLSIDRPPIYVQRRCDDAIAVSERRSELLQHYKSNKHGLSFLCLSAGTAHLPQLLGKDGLPIWESTACAAYLKQHSRNQSNIDNVDIYVETTSYDTIGNAFFARTTHTELNAWRNLLVVTNEFHMERTRAIFDWIFLECSAESSRQKASRNRDYNNNYELHYLESPNVGLTDEAVTARKEREAASLKTLQEKIMPQLTNLPDVYRFLTHEHALYTAHKLVDRGRGSNNNEASEQVKKSYGGV
jgi:uncharacterized SAM-binding protein YcdF (DUF218 family)